MIFAVGTATTVQINVTVSVRIARTSWGEAVKVGAKFGGAAVGGRRVYENYIYSYTHITILALRHYIFLSNTTMSRVAYML